MSPLSSSTGRWAASAVAASVAAGLLATSAAATRVDAPAPATTVVAASALPAGPAPVAYAPGSKDDTRNAQARRQLERALAQRSGGYGNAGRAAADGSVRVITYDASDAPSFQREIEQAVAIWNQALTGVELVPDSSGWADFRYHEEPSRPDGSFAYTEFDGYGDIVIDVAQATATGQQLRVVTHETGHILGLPDHYEGPCNELMSGGGPGPDCRNPYPNSTEVAGAEAAMAATRPWWQGWGWAAYAS